MKRLDVKFRNQLMRLVKDQFRPDLTGIHGCAHWARVRDNGLRMCRNTVGADPVVIELFAILHDSQRENDGDDPQHGMRAAHFMSTLSSSNTLGFNTYVTTEQYLLAKAACFLHSDARVSTEPSVGTCWDADRLDLPRIGIAVNPELLSTAAAKRPQMIAWAWHRASSLLRHNNMRMQA